MVVEESQDVFDLERSGHYNGLYHVLHGSISPVKSISPNDLYSLNWCSVWTRNPSLKSSWRLAAATKVRNRHVYSAQCIGGQRCKNHPIIA
jgi:hypothetical protein